MSPGGPPEIGATAMAAVALLTVLALGAHWFLRSRGVGGGSAIRVVAMRPLGGKRAVAVVEVEGERFLLGLTDEAVSFLSRLDPSQVEHARPVPARANA